MKKQENSTLDTVQQRIAHGGHLLSIACTVARIALSISMAANCVLLIAGFFSPEAIKTATEVIEDNFLYRALNDTGVLGGMEDVYRTAIGCFVALITTAVLYLFATTAQKMFKRLANGDRPFNQETARKMRHGAWLMLLMVVYNLPLGLIAFAILLLFSYIMEYGGYIQEQADERNRIQEEMIVSFAEITENKSGQTGQHITGRRLNNRQIEG